MSKVLQVVIYKSVSDEEKLAAYAKLALPAMEKAGAKFIARGIPVAVREEGQKTRTVVIEWPSMEAADKGYNGPRISSCPKSFGWICLSRIQIRRNNLISDSEKPVHSLVSLIN
jgi:uncharacterized protein (DUF1330 family)